MFKKIGARFWCFGARGAPGSDLSDRLQRYDFGRIIYPLLRGGSFTSLSGELLAVSSRRPSAVGSITRTTSC